MYLLSDTEINFIHNDLKQKGIVLDDLQQNLLDHICCIIEQELEEGGDFEQYYQITLRKFYTNRLDELEEETQLLLTFKHFYTMKKLMLGTGIVSITFLGLGIVFKYMYLPGASFLIAGGILMLSLLFLPLYFTLKIKEEKQTRDKLLIGLASLVCISFSLATLFKVMHWPGANVMGLTSLLVLLLLFLPIYFITGIRNPDTKVNTIVSSVLILGGCGLFLTLTRSPKGTEVQQKAITSQLVRSEMILQNELNLLHKIKPGDTSSAGAQLVSLCEDMKAKIVLRETGCASLVNDYSCKATLINDGPMNHNVFGNTSLQQQQEQLNELITRYNQTTNLNKQRQIPIQEIKSESISGMIQYLIQIEMFVLQNERELIAAN